VTRLFLPILILIAVHVAVTPTARAQSSAPFTDVILRFTATDGTPLEGKLSIPAGATGPVPVVFELHGAGPRNYDNAVRFRDTDGQLKTIRYYDYYAREYARRGVAFFRMSKRGCSADSTGRPIVDRAIFSKATSTVLLSDYERGLDELRRRGEIDATRIVLGDSSEGTRLAPMLALRSPNGIVALSLMSYQADNLHDTVVWQNTEGPWRNVTRLIPGAADSALTRAEYDAAVAGDASIAPRLPFAILDADTSGVVTPAELQRLTKPRLDAILKAVEDRNDDLLWQALLNLSSAYLLDGWNAEPTSSSLLRVDLPIAIYHGELDGTTRVEGVRETAAAFREAGKSNLTTNFYPALDHDLGWTPQEASGPGPQPYQDAFDWVARISRRQ
jgi:pimeloyl-ACP methyl ester carboxylesterase